MCNIFQFNKLFHQFLRIIGEGRRPGLNTANSTLATTNDQLPPAYCAVQIGQELLTTTNSTSPPSSSVQPTTTDTNVGDISGPRVLYNSQTHRIRTLKLHRRATAAVTDSSQNSIPPATNAFSSGADTLPRISTTSRASVLPSSQLTSRDVAQILRPSNLEQYHHELDNPSGTRLNRSMSVRPSARYNFSEQARQEESTVPTDIISNPNSVI